MLKNFLTKNFWQNKKHARRMRCLAGALALVILGTGCGIRMDDNFTSMNERAVVRFSWWGNDVRHQYTMDAMDIFMSQNPLIKVSMKYGVWNGYEKRNQVSMLSNTEADVMQINNAWLEQYSPDGEGYYDLYKLKDYIDFRNFDESDLKYGEIDGKLNGIPIAFNTVVFFYNKTIYDQYGLDIPRTWDDFFTAAEAMSKDGIYPIGMVKKQLFMFLIAHYEQEHGTTVFGEDGQLEIDYKGMVEILKYYRQLVDKKVICPIDEFDRIKYLDGQIAGTLCWISDASNYADSLEDRGMEVALGETPVLENAKLLGWYVKPACLYAISKSTTRPREAAILLDFLLNSPEMALLQKSEKGVPISKFAVKTLQDNGDLDNYEYKATELLRERMEEYGKLLPVMENAKVIDAFKSNADEYLYDKMKVKACAKQLVNDINAITSGS